jgi:regulator of sirC expression with transglutaminase-like and TPR domain
MRATMEASAEEARRKLTAIARGTDASIDVARAALLIACEEYAPLDVDAYLARLDSLAEAARPRLAGARSFPEQVSRLNDYLFVQCRFTGNAEDYYDPRNSYLNEVLDRRKGIPISLSLVYCEVARRLGIPAYGVNFPGHFLVRCAVGGGIIVDAFLGQVIDVPECARRFSAVHGEEARFDPDVLQPASPRTILVRLLMNLKQIYVEEDDDARALRCVERILLFSPDIASEIRDRGLLFHKLECYAAAARDLQRYVEMAPDDPTSNDIRELLPELQRQAAQLH